jgi:hypothetical protein
MVRVLLVNFISMKTIRNLIFIVHQKRHLIKTAAKSIIFVPTLSDDEAIGKILSLDCEEDKC